MGGIRWKASGNKRIWVRCANCGKRGWKKLYHQDPADPARIDDATGSPG
jgi:hypothetical protein